MRESPASIDGRGESEEPRAGLAYVARGNRGELKDTTTSLHRRDPALDQGERSRMALASELLILLRFIRCVPIRGQDVEESTGIFCWRS